MYTHSLGACVAIILMFGVWWPYTGDGPGYILRMVLAAVRRIGFIDSFFYFLLIFGNWAIVFIQLFHRKLNRALSSHKVIYRNFQYFTITEIY